MKKTALLLAFIYVLAMCTSCKSKSSEVKISEESGQISVSVDDSSTDVSTDTDSLQTPSETEITGQEIVEGSQSVIDTSEDPINPPVNSGAETVKETVVKDIDVNSDVNVEESKSPEIAATVEVNTNHTPISPTEYYQYSKLNATEKTAYKRIIEAVKDTQNVVDLKGLGIDRNRISVVLQNTLADYPQLFWVSKTSSISYDSETGIVNVLILYYTDGRTVDEVGSDLKLIKSADRSIISNQINEFNSGVKAVVNTVSASLPKIEMEKKLHDIVLEKLTYDDAAAGGSTANSRSFDAYGAMCKNTAVCEGYSKLFQYLCYCVGINATQVSGYSKGVGHMWNAVNIGSWYLVDTTWDDGVNNGCPYYAYFNLTSAQMGKDHEVRNSGLAVPTCTATELSYTNYFCCNVVSLSSSPSNISSSADRIASDNNEEYLIIHFDGCDATQGYLTDHFISSSSEFQKYIKSKGYSYSLKRSYFSVGSFIYIRVER